MKYDVLIRIDKLNTDLSEDDIICDRSQIKIFLEI